jgi:energy-coupling factor transporter ATP-binding protein EcfA2
MRLARLELKDIGPFEDAVFEIPEPAKGTGELVLFEGPNGCGKTTILQAMACAAEPPTGGAYDEPTALHAPFEELARRARSRNGPLTSAKVEEAGEFLVVNGPRHWVKWFPAEGVRTPAAKLIIDAHSAARGEPNAALRWAAFAYQGHQLTPIVATKGPANIEAPSLAGALSFGAVEPASAHFGQLLVNLDQEIAKAFLEAHRNGISDERKAELDRLADARRRMVGEITQAISRALNRKVTIEVPVGQHSPTVFVDGEAIPVGLLGEGMRSTLAWLSDLLVRLERIPWVDTTRSPLEQDFWLILDEIEQSLHPTMQAHIYPALRELFPNARIYATTHSPFVVASLGEGTIFPIRPDRDHKVRGIVKARPLRPGQSLELVTSDIFQAPSGFVDQQTQDDVRAHDRDIIALRQKKDIDWETFFVRRERLMSLNAEVQTLVAMQEVPVKNEIVRRIRERIEQKEREARP